jgi:hypothetical protein
MSRFTPFRGRPKRPRTGLSILAQSDLTYVNTSQFPYTWNGVEVLYFMAGLAFRYVNGERRFFSRLYSDIVEYTCTPGSAPVFVANHGRLWTDPVTEGGHNCNALHFHQTNADGSGYLWMPHAYFYHTTGDNDAHISVATFSGASLSSTAGPFTTPSSSAYQKTRSGVTGWTNGNILFGAGGYYSGVQAASLGFHAMEASPTPPGGSALSGTTLVDHLFNSSTWATSARRFGDYVSTGHPDSPDDGIWPQPDGGPEPNGKWQYFQQNTCMCYVNTGTKHGVIVTSEEPTGEIIYDTGGSSPGTIFKVAWRIFDPTQVAAASGGALEPVRYFRIAQGDMGDANYGRELSAWNEGGNTAINTGMVYDPTAGQVIAFSQKLGLTGGGAPEYQRLPGLVFWSVA